MSSSPILIVPGEKKSIFFEIFFKSINSKKFISPLILVCSKKILNKEIKNFRFNIKIELINLDQIIKKRLKKRGLYIIDINSHNSKTYIQDCFSLAFKIIKQGLSNKLINDFFKNLNGQIKIIGVGGVESGETAYKKFLSGANFVQLYTGMVFRGPKIAIKINEELKKILKEKKIKNYSDIIGKL